MHKSKVYKIAQTIDALRRHHNLEKDLGIDAAKNGRDLLRCRYRLAQIEAEEDLMDSPIEISGITVDKKLRDKIKDDDQYCFREFKEVAKKIELVRETSSPILKVIKFAKIMEELTCLNAEEGEIAAADESLPLIFYLLTTMKAKKNAYLGARFIEECTYVTDFCQEE